MKTWLLLILIVASCSPATAINFNLYTESGDLKVNCNLNNIEVREVKEEDVKIFNMKSNKLTFLYGKISLYNNSNTRIKYNLKDYYIFIGDIKSSGLYIDSRIDYIIIDKELAPKERVIKSVYWVFDGEIDNNDLQQIRLKLQEK